MYSVWRFPLRHTPLAWEPPWRITLDRITYEKNNVAMVHTVCLHHWNGHVQWFISVDTSSIANITIWNAAFNFVWFEIEFFNIGRETTNTVCRHFCRIFGGVLFSENSFGRLMQPQQTKIRRTRVYISRDDGMNCICLFALIPSNDRKLFRQDITRGWVTLQHTGGVWLGCGWVRVCVCVCVCVGGGMATDIRVMSCQREVVSRRCKTCDQEHRVQPIYLYTWGWWWWWWWWWWGSWGPG